MSGLAIGTLRVGSKYRITNYGDKYDVELINKISDVDLVFRDLHTLEKLCLHDIICFGKGRDWCIEEHPAD